MPAPCPDCTGCRTAARARDNRDLCARCYLHAENPTAYQPCPNLLTTTGETP